MESMDIPTKPHAVCVPYPAQGHINPMLKLAKLLHHKGFRITFVNTEFNHRRLLKSRGPDSLNGLRSFQFKTITDGLPPSERDATQDIPALCDSIRKNCLAPFRELISELNRTDGTPVTCIVADMGMSFTLEVAEELGIREVMLWTASACASMCYAQHRRLVEKGFLPLKDTSYLTNGYLDTVIDWIPGINEIRLRDLPSFFRTTDPDDIVVNFVVAEFERVHKASAVIFNTFDALEKQVLEALSEILPPIYTIGPLHLLLNQIPQTDLNFIESNLWKEDSECLQWLDSKPPNSVVYINFGSVTVISYDQLIEFAWGLANSDQNFLWVIRPDLIVDDTAKIPSPFVTETKERGLLASWCPQQEVLSHPSVGGFLTHSGWNSTIESISVGVPMICWPFFADQQTNCLFCCREWGIGMEIDSEVKRDEVEGLVRELMWGEKGMEMKKKALEWNKLADEAAAGPTGSSYLNLEKMINQVLLSKSDQI